MFITLLTHANEPAKPSNTGKLVIDVARKMNIPCEKVIWQRKQPDEALLERLSSADSVLVYPGDPSRSPAAAGPEHWVLIDSTWQQAQKILNHSPYLHSLPRYQISPTRPSRYHLRRNQVAGGLCTLESVRELALAQGQTDFASALDGTLTEWLAGGR